MKLDRVDVVMGPTNLCAQAKAILCSCCSVTVASQLLVIPVLSVAHHILYVCVYICTNGTCYSIACGSVHIHIQYVYTCASVS